MFHPNLSGVIFACIPHAALQLKGFTLTLYGRILFVVNLHATCFTRAYIPGTQAQLLFIEYALYIDIQVSFVHNYVICLISLLHRFLCTHIRIYIKNVNNLHLLTQRR